MSKLERKFSILVIGFCIVIFSAIYYLGLISQTVITWYITVSLITFIIYGWDKFKAKRNGWRVPEKHLHLLSLVGGWFGALLAQHWLKHKSSKVSFRRLFWLTLLCNLSGLIWLHSTYADSLISVFRL